MTAITTYPPGVPCFVDTLVDDLDAARRFYGGVFGWEFSGPGPLGGGADGEYRLALALGSIVAGLGTTPGPDTPRGWSTHVAVADVEESCVRVVDAGGAIRVAPFDAAPAGRLAVVADPAGATISLWQAMDRPGAEIVNEPSAWAMSLMLAPDLGAAATFYETVFGWRAEPFGEDDAMRLLRLPGYVGGEQQQPVPRDVVAAMAPGDSPGWMVDFWIADADVAAAAAPELGGAVVQAPHDVPMFRRTVLAAPDGAVFSVSELVRPGRSGDR